MGRGGDKVIKESAPWPPYLPVSTSPCSRHIACQIRRDVLEYDYREE